MQTNMNISFYEVEKECSHNCNLEVVGSNHTATTTTNQQWSRMTLSMIGVLNIVLQQEKSDQTWVS